MDRFVVRSSSVKYLNHPKLTIKTTKDYPGTAKKSNAYDIKSKTQPLQEKEINNLSKNVSSERETDDRLIMENNCNSNDSGVSSTLSLASVTSNSDAEEQNNKILKKNYLGKLGDYLDCPADKENDTTLIITPNSKAMKLDPLQIDDYAVTMANLKDAPRSAITAEQIAITTEKQSVKHNPAVMARISRDINSPSASVRHRALKGLKNPTLHGYTQFDIPDVEQSFQIPQEEIPSLQDVMRNVIVYVEVRTNEDNRSAGVRKVIENLGARVNLTMLRDTTHVVFKDGLLSTYKKAKVWGIPIVSILWIEACRTQHRLCDPMDYPISNIDRYENPELYAKMKRIKYMQPDSESNKRIRNRAGGTPTSAQKTSSHKTNPLLIDNTTPTTHKRHITKRPMDISQYFKRIYGEKQTSIDGLNSPTTQLLNRMQTEVELLNAQASQLDARKTLSFGEASPTKDKSAKAVASKNAVKQAANKTTLARRGGTPPSTYQKCAGGNVEVHAAASAIEAMSICNSPPVDASRRRSSLCILEDTSMTDASLSVKETSNSLYLNTPKRSGVKRRTLYSIKAMELSNVKENRIGLIDNPNNEEISCDDSAKPKKSRRTLYSALAMEIDEDTEREKGQPRQKLITSTKEVSSSKSTNNSLRLLSGEGSDITLTPGVNIGDSKNVAVERSKLLTRADIIAKETKPQNKSLTPKKLVDIKITALTPISPDVNGGICVTPSRSKTLCMAQRPATIAAAMAATTASCSMFLTSDTVDSALEEDFKMCNTPSVIFNSKRPVGRRRTLFDVSMDIINQRVQLINERKSRHSINTVHESETTTAEKFANSNSPVEEKTANSYTPEKLHTEIGNEAIQSPTDVTPPNMGHSISHIKRKRKLFPPIELLSTRTSPLKETLIPSKGFSGTDKIVEKLSTRQSLTAKSSSVKTKHRRTLMPISISQPETGVSKQTKEKFLKSRRSTMEFEPLKRNSKKSETLLPTSPNCRNIGAIRIKKIESKTQKFKSKKKLPTMVHTNMRKSEVNVIRETVNQLGGFILGDIVNDDTTHLITYESRRTLNLLRAMARGLWIVEYNWIVESAKIGRWLPEEPFEVHDFSRAIEICRSEKQAFGDFYKCELFHNVGPIYVSSRCSPVSKENVKELITICGGKITGSRSKARYIVGSPIGNFGELPPKELLQQQQNGEKCYVSPFWILDSITEMQILKLQKYAFKP
uniref:BRCT domain-containing protein n=1 Tax=Glossina brevipalpis TaxID=37001 RepID=A0A1A9W6X8_9MUSC